jgi:hypothetical protein
LGVKVEFLFLVFVAAIVVWVRYQNGKQKVSATTPTKPTKKMHKSKKSGTGKLRFQETGTPPRTDSQGRVIVKLAGGTPGVTFGVNKLHLSTDVGQKIAGKPNDDEEFAKSVRVRVRRDRESQFPNSFILETSDGRLIGWILKEDSTEAALVFDQLDSALRQTAPELATRELVFEVSLRVEGYWNEEDYEAEGGLVWEPDFDIMEIRIKSPAEVEID